jgi:hypothetical protein
MINGWGGIMDGDSYLAITSNYVAVCYDATGERLLFKIKQKRDRLNVG